MLSLHVTIKAGYVDTHPEPFFGITTIRAHHSGMSVMGPVPVSSAFPCMQTSGSLH